MAEKGAPPDAAFGRGVALLVALAAGLTGVIGGLLRASECWNGNFEREVPSAAYSGAIIFLGGCACIVSVVRAVSR